MNLHCSIRHLTVIGSHQRDTILRGRIINGTCGLWRSHTTTFAISDSDRSKMVTCVVLYNRNVTIGSSDEFVAGKFRYIILFANCCCGVSFICSTIVSGNKHTAISILTSSEQSHYLTSSKTSHLNARTFTISIQEVREQSVELFLLATILILKSNGFTCQCEVRPVVLVTL